MVCKVCCPGMMLCAACLAEDEEPPTLRMMPRTNYVRGGRSLRPYNPVVLNPPRIQRERLNYSSVVTGQH